MRSSHLADSVTGRLVRGACAIGISAGVLIGCSGAEEGSLPADVNNQTESDADSGLATASQPISGTSTPGPYEILVCPDVNTAQYRYGGNCVKVPLGMFPNSAGVGNDTMSSIKVGSEVRATLCRDSAFRGNCQTFDPGTTRANLGNESIGNDTVSSIRIAPAATPDCRNRSIDNPPPAGWVFLYRDQYWQGDCVAVSSGSYYNVLDIGLANDSISSWLVPADCHTLVDMYNEQGWVGKYGIYSSYDGCIGDWARDQTMGVMYWGFNDVVTSLVVYGT